MHYPGLSYLAIKTDMLKFRFTLFFLCFTISAYAQTRDENLHNMIQGIRQEAITFYEVSGYQVFHQALQKPISEKSIKKFKKKYGFDKYLLPSTIKLDQEYLVFETSRSLVEGNLQPGRAHYTYQDEKGNGFLIGFTYLSSRDTAIEHYMVNTIRSKTLPETVYSPQRVDSIKYAGRYIQLGPACRWMNTHNIQCPNYGQMNWSEFRDSTRAVEMTEFQRALNNQKFLTKEKESNYEDVLFEGVETRVLRTKVKIKLPKLVVGGSNVLVVYYVTAKVRDRYVSCVLSHYTDDVNAEGLPPLLSEVMELK